MLNFQLPRSSGGYKLCQYKCPFRQRIRNRIHLIGDTYPAYTNKCMLINEFLKSRAHTSVALC